MSPIQTKKNVIEVTVSNTKNTRHTTAYLFLKGKESIRTFHKYIKAFGGDDLTRERDNNTNQASVKQEEQTHPVTF